MWPATDQTTQLLAGARVGEADAVDRLLERHRAAVHRLVQMRLDPKLQQRLDVSDVVQDVFVEAHRRLAHYLENPLLPFHLWLRQIAQDRIIDAHRRHRGSARRSLDREAPLGAASDDPSALDLVAQLRDPQLTPAAAVAQRELAQQVEQAIARLNDQDAEIVVMRHYEQLSNQEVAQALGLSEPAASMRYLRAIRRLRELLAEPAPSQAT